MTPTIFESERERMESVWRLRATRLSSRSSTATTTGPANEVVVMVLKIGAERYGVELEGVAEVLPPVCPTPVPGGPHALAGVIDVQGEIRPVIDLKRMLYLGSSELTADTPVPVVLLRASGRRLGLQVDGIEQILRIPSAEIRSVRDGSADLPARYFKSFTKDGLMILNANSLFAELGMGENLE